MLSFCVGEVALKAGVWLEAKIKQVPGATLKTDCDLLASFSFSRHLPFSPQMETKVIYKYNSFHLCFCFHSDYSEYIRMRG